MSYNPPNPNGQTASTNSQSVVLSTDQPPVPFILTSSTAAAAAGLKASITAYGYQRMTLEPRIEFVDPFDGNVIDTTNLWTTSGTTSQANSSAIIGNITTTNTVNSLTSKP